MEDQSGKPVRKGFYIHTQGTGEIPLFVSRKSNSWYVESFQDKKPGRIPLEQNYASFLTPAKRSFVKNYIRETRENGTRLLREAEFYESKLTETAEQSKNNSGDIKNIEFQLRICSS